MLLFHYQKSSTFQKKNSFKQCIQIITRFSKIFFAYHLLRKHLINKERQTVISKHYLQCRSSPSCSFNSCSPVRLQMESFLCASTDTVMMLQHLYISNYILFWHELQGTKLASSAVRMLLFPPSPHTSINCLNGIPILNFKT